MAIGSGLDAQVGFGEETGYNVYQAPTRFLPFDQESIEPTVEQLRQAGIDGRYPVASRARTVVKGAAGSITLPLTTLGCGFLFGQALGNVVTNTVASGHFSHVITPAANGPRGKSLTVQVGRPAEDGVIHPFSFVGGKVMEWAVAASVDELATLELTMDFASVDTTQTLATATIPAALRNYAWMDAALVIGGSAQVVSSASVRGTNGLDVNNLALGNTRKEPEPAEAGAITGELEAWFEDLVAFNAWREGTQLANLVLTLTGQDEVVAGTKYSLEITVPAIEYTGVSVPVSGPAQVRQAAQWRALKGSGAICTVTVVTSEATP